MNSPVDRVVVEVSIDAELAMNARRTGTDMDRAAEAGIRRAVELDAVEGEARRQAWKAENAEAIRSYNDYIRNNGLPLAKYRTF